MRAALLALTLIAAGFAAGCNGAQVLNLAARDAGEVTRDRSYGPLARQTFDVYSPHEMADDTPVLLFIHGGSWQNGSKDDYRFLGAAFARAGVQTVVINYRLYPDVIFPDFMTDAALAVAEVKRRVAGDRPVILAGHSAGAQIATLLAGDPRYLAAAGTTICEAAAGIIAVAGPFTFTPIAPEFRAIFPPDRLDAARPLNFATTPRPATLLLHGTADETVLPVRSQEYQAALRAAGQQAELKLYAGVDHTIIIGAISPVVRGRADTFADMLGFIRERAAPEAAGCPS